MNNKKIKQQEEQTMNSKNLKTILKDFSRCVALRQFLGAAEEDTIMNSFVEEKFNPSYVKNLKRCKTRMDIFEVFFEKSLARYCWFRETGGKIFWKKLCVQSLPLYGLGKSDHLVHSAGDEIYDDFHMWRVYDA